MSYYQPSTTRHQTTLTSQMNNLPPAAEPLATQKMDMEPRVMVTDQDATLAEGLISPSATSAPLAMPQPSGAGGRKVQQQQQKTRSKPGRLTSAQMQAWMDHLCHYPPLGSCARRLVEGGTHCAMHSCRAINDDGNRCGNLVIDPSQGRYCHNGWHNETSTYSPVEDLKAARKAHDSLRATHRELEFAEHATYFSTHFPSALNSSICSTLSSNDASASGSGSRSGSTSATSDQGRQSLNKGNDPNAPRTKHDRQRSTSLENESGWGAYGIDKWWVGEWRRTLAPSAPAPGTNTANNPGGRSNGSAAGGNGTVKARNGNGVAAGRR